MKNNIDKELVKLAKDMILSSANFLAEVASDEGRVKVVRCEDCLHYELGACLKIYEDGAVAKEAWQQRKPDDYCSYGERRKDDEQKP